MPSTKAEGTQLAVISTEHTLLTATDQATYVLILDCANMASADVLEVRVKGRAKSAGTTREVYVYTLANVQSPPIFVSDPFPGVVSTVFTITQTAGTGRNFDYRVEAL